MTLTGIFSRVAAIGLMVGLCSCSGGSGSANAGTKSKKLNGLPAPTVDAQDSSTLAVAAGCDPGLWNHVYTPDRLQKLSPCMTVAGTIEESNVDDDGDQHFLINVGPGQKNLINKRNMKKKNGDLVGEIVCANPTRQKKSRAACANYTNRVPLPTVGDHVKVTGSYVIDSHNGWTELHPVSRIDKQ
jgi:hypothetical protein